jgi:hypothetical protein
MVVDYQSSNDNVINDSVIMLDMSMDAERTMTLTKQFKGLELSQPVRLLEARPDCAVLQTTDKTLVPLLEGSVFLRSQAFSTSIVGHVKNMNYVDGTFHLADFSIQDWKERQSERVQPKEPVYVTLRWRNKEARVCMEDISTIGMGVFAGSEVGRQIHIQPGLGVHLEFDMAGIPFENLEGRLLYRQRVGQYVDKLGLRLFPNGKQRRILDQYVTQRRREILEEIGEIYLRSREPRGIESQYF